jgi:hypothetical protein
MFTFYTQNLELIMHRMTLLNKLIICLLIAICIYTFYYCICNDFGFNENPHENQMNPNDSTSDTSTRYSTQYEIQYFDSPNPNENPHKNKLIRIYPINNKQLDELKEIENRFEVRFLSLLQINSKSLTIATKMINVLVLIKDIN